VQDLEAVTVYHQSLDTQQLEAVDDLDLSTEPAQFTRRRRCRIVACPYRR